jgi:TonB-dependent starch-binding outer membrane protein SusC
LKKNEGNCFAQIFTKSQKQLKVMKKKLFNHDLWLKIMKISIIQLVFAICFVGVCYSREADAQEILETRINIRLEEKSLKTILSKLEKETKVKFMYSAEVIQVDRITSLYAKNQPLREVLEAFLSPLNIAFRSTNNGIILTPKPIKLGQIQGIMSPKIELPFPLDINIKGIVADENDEKLPGVSIAVKGTTRGSNTNLNGEYLISVPDVNAVLVFSFVGYKSQEVVVGNRTTINVVLNVDNKALDEVVVIGYGTQKKKDLTGAVASVNIENSKLQPNTNAAQILRGTTAGVLVTDNGRPGQSGTIRIRGINSISASTSPLIVLDGIIYAGGNLSDINPGDIETIDVLKDASSTAIYGSLAANGVIEITTKKGKTGKPKFSFNSYTGVSDYAFLPKYLNAEQYLAARKDAEIAAGGVVPFQPIELENIAAGKSVNPFDEIKQTAPLSNYELSVAGKTDKVNYFFSGGYMNAKSPVRGDNFSRISSRLNLGVQATDWLKLGINSGYSSRDDSGVRASLINTTYLSPYASLYMPDGVTPRVLPMDIGLVANPLFGNILNTRYSLTNVLFTNVYADLSIVDGLSYKINGGYTRTDSKLFTYNPSFALTNSLGSGSKRNTESQNLTVENIVKYQRRIANKHSFDLTLLYGIYELENQFSFLSSQNIFNDALGYDALEIGNSFNIDAGASKNKQTSSMARLGYSYSSKYFLTLSMRRDGYSAFGDGKKYGIFPAAALSWNVTEEDFLKDIKQIDFLKLRASWGRNGNRGVSEYSSLSQVGQANYVFGDGGPTTVGLYSTSFANPNLGWETSESFNLGLDVELFSSRVTSSINFYSTKTFDLLLSQTIPNTNGYETFLRNIGETANNGLEIDLKTVNIKKGDFTWNTNLAFSFNRNKIVKLTGRDINQDGIEDDDIASGWFIGKPLGSNFDYVFDGIFQTGDDLTLITGAKIGDIRFKDINGPAGVPDGKITALDRTVISNNQPDFNMGITNIFRYKGFSLSSTFNIRQGGLSPIATLNPGSSFFDQANFLNVPYWTPTNPINTAPRIDYRNPLGYGFYSDRSFVRLQDVSLGYEVPQKLLSKLHINTLQIFASGKNLATWTDWKGWDPEFGSGSREPGNNGPLLKTFTAGINLTF